MWRRKILPESKLPDPETCKVIVNAGNDDPFFVDEILDKSNKIIRPEGQIIELPAKLKLLSTGYTTKTPWPCPREKSEEELKELISSMTDQIFEADKLIFNFHCPPYNTSLDLANNIDRTTLQKKYGKQHVGSKSIRKAIEYWQPIASLHGHIHEVCAKENIKNSICYNPGSDYSNGKLQGVFLQINEKGNIEFETLTVEKISETSETETTRIIKTVMKSLPVIGSFYKDFSSTKNTNEIKSAIDNLSEDIKEIKNKLK